MTNATNKSHTYKGHHIYECERVKGEHAGRWTVQTYHRPTGLPFGDEHCPHFSSLAEAKAYITEAADWTSIEADDDAREAAELGINFAKGIY